MMEDRTTPLLVYPYTLKKVSDRKGSAVVFIREKKTDYNIVSCEAVFYEQTGWHIYLKMWKKEPKKAGQGGKRSGNRKKNKAAPDIKA